jgi:transcriptional regulator with XRE-family HTH domain
MKVDKFKEARIELCISLRDAASRRGITHQRIADATGMRRSSVTRMLSGHFPPTLDYLLKLADAIDLEIKFHEK